MILALEEKAEIFECLRNSHVRLALLVKPAAISLNKRNKGDYVIIHMRRGVSRSAFELSFQTGGTLIKNQCPCIRLMRFVDALTCAVWFACFLPVEDIHCELSVGLGTLNRVRGCSIARACVILDGGDDVTRLFVVLLDIELNYVQDLIETGWVSRGSDIEDIVLQSRYGATEL